MHIMQLTDCYSLARSLQQHFPAMSTLQGREQGEWTQRPHSIVAYKNHNFLSVGVHTK